MQKLIAELHKKLRTIAARQMAKERADHTMQPTELVHEAFFRLARQRILVDASRETLLAAAAVTMHRLLIDYAKSSKRRRSLEQKGAEPYISSELQAKSSGTPLDILSLDDAMQKLARHDRRLARIVECRVFAAMTSKEIADVMGVSVSTIEHQWSVAKKWLRQEFKRGQDKDPAVGGPPDSTDEG